MAVSSSCFSTVYALSKHSFPSFSLHFSLCSVRRRGAPRRYIVSANLGGGEGGFNKGGKKKFITREEEPDQYWQTAGEREGENPMKTPLPYIILFGMATPFVILAIAFANGWIKVPIR
ncbi:unnamed protein product [Cuscuta epithymum]|uniref:Transmembrane protein n=1 Tax=Cuscuta epithymum TaxID=186058 RepID=A0AAV0F4Z9_9ASTE|nr:unnamed protein product [Cuscuta epithymum]